MSECSLDRVTISFCIYTHSSLPFLNTYTRNSIFARALPLALICSSLSICLRLSWEILTLCQLHGNEYFFFLRYFRRVRIAFRSWLFLFLFSFHFHLGGRRGPCFLFCHLISFLFFFLRVVPSRRLCFILPDPRYVFLFVFFFGRIRRKRGGGTKSSLNSLVKSCINSIPYFCWSVSSELLF